VIDLPKDEVDELAAAAASLELDELLRLFAVFTRRRRKSASPSIRRSRSR
jgi:hypothetical protein